MNVAPRETMRLTEALTRELEKVIVGQQVTIELVLCALFTRGHVLLEGVPGTAKTLLVRALAAALGLQSKRVQFTPDLMPSDILGTNVFDLESRRFHLVRGPLFTDLLLADEINRTPAKTQSALLEAMEERRVTIDGEPHPLSPAFTVFATQNPLEHECTYPLPEAQLDRFLMKLVVDYPSEGEEDLILQRFHAGFDPGDLSRVGLRAVATADELASVRASLQGARDGTGVTVPESVLRYIRQIVRRTRGHPQLHVGAGPRASIALLLASKTLAAMRGRDFTTPDDVKTLARPVLRHRVLLDPEAELDGLRADEVLGGILAEVEVPR